MSHPVQYYESTEVGGFYLVHCVNHAGAVERVHCRVEHTREYTELYEPFHLLLSIGYKTVDTVNTDSR